MKKNLKTLSMTITTALLLSLSVATGSEGALLFPPVVTESEEGAVPEEGSIQALDNDDDDFIELEKPLQ